VNLTLLAALLLLVVWIVLVFVAHIATGPVQLLYAGAVILFARRVLFGAPAFRS
jgi:hypothetical protein